MSRPRCLRRAARSTRCAGSGVRVFAFSAGRAASRTSTCMRPVELFGLTLDERLRPLDAGHIVIIAGTAGPWPIACPGNQIRHGSSLPGRRHCREGGRRRDTDAGRYRRAGGLPHGPKMGATGVVSPAAIIVSTTGDQAEIGSTTSRSLRRGRGLAVVEMGSRLPCRLCRPAGTGHGAFRSTMRPRPLVEVEGPIPPESCAELGEGEWEPLGLMAVSALVAYLDNRGPATADWKCTSRPENR